MMRRVLSGCIACGILAFFSSPVFAQDKPAEKAKPAEEAAKPAEEAAKPAEEAAKPAEEAAKPAEEAAKPAEESAKPAEEAAKTPAEKAPEAVVDKPLVMDKDSSESTEATAEPEVSWPYQQPLFALHAKPQSHVRVGAGYATNPDVDSMAFFLEAAYAFGDIGVHVRMPMGMSMNDEMGNEFTLGDLELGVQWLITHEKETNKHLAVGLDLIGPLSRMGEEKDLAGVQAGDVIDESNFGKRYLLAQKPFLDIGLVPKLNMGFVPHVAFGQNIGRVSLQTDFGCMILVMDNVDETIYGTDRRLGFILFYDLAAPVAITQEFSIVTEFNAAVGLDGLLGTGFAFTIGPRYTTSGFSAGLGIQLPVGVDNKPPDDDKMVGRYDSALLVRHHIAAILDLSYSF